MFDLASNRLSFSELLMPEVGYELVFATGLTYSLDLEALLGIPISLGLLDDVDSDLLRSPFYLLEAIRKSSDKIAIFCNAGNISLPQKIESIYSLLENSVFDIRLKNKQNFHPKIWFIKYTNDKEESYIKLLILSRNLTFDNSIDICVAMQGDITGVRRNKNKPLADMLKFVAGYADKIKKEKVLGLAEEIMYVKKFDISHPFEDYEFLPLGINGCNKDQTGLFEQKSDIIVVSPFLSDSVLRDLTNRSNRKVLLTKKSSLTSTAFNCFNEVYITKDVLSDNEFGAKQDIHLKLYFTTTNISNYLYIGSANASYNAFNKNVEFLLKLKYKPYCMGFKTFYNSFFPAEDSPYEIVKIIPEKKVPDEIQILIDKAFKEAIYALKYAKVISQNGIYNIEIKSKKIKIEETILIAPLQRRAMMEPLREDNVFSGLLLRELSEFYILSVKDQKIILKLETKGIPKNDRDNAIYKSIIDTKEKFLTYISFMLSEDYSAEILDYADYTGLNSHNDEIKGNMYFTGSIYEKMLKTLHKNPGRLKEIKDIIKRLDNDVINKEFYELYNQFEKALRRLRK